MTSINGISSCSKNIGPSRNMVLFYAIHYFHTYLINNFTFQVSTLNAGEHTALARAFWILGIESNLRDNRPRGSNLKKGLSERERGVWHCCDVWAHLLDRTITAMPMRVTYIIQQSAAQTKIWTDKYVVADDDGYLANNDVYCIAIIWDDMYSYLLVLNKIKQICVGWILFQNYSIYDTELIDLKSK